MSRKTVQEVRSRLEEAVAAAQARGFRVAPGEWGVEAVDAAPEDPDNFDEVWRAENPPEKGGCLCPMACVLIDKPVEDLVSSDNCDEAAAYELGIEEDEVSNFIVGFDAAECDVSDYEEDEFYALGKEFRKKLAAA